MRSSPPQLSSMFRPRAIRPANATRADPVWAKRVACVARLLVAAVALWIMAAPLQAAERETRVLVLNGADPYLPAYRVIDSSMRETLAKDHDATISVLR